MLARLKDALKGLGGEWVVSFTTTSPEVSELFRELNGKDVSIEIKRYYRKRSLDANAYCWVLIDKLAQKTGINKSEVYRNAIREIGGVSTTVCVLDKAVERLKLSWQAHGMGWQADVTDSKLEGCKNVTLYYGSSVYDTEQMSLLINSLKQDAEAQGIPTITPEEEQRLLAQWGRK